MSCEEKDGFANADLGIEAIRDILSLLGIASHKDPSAFTSAEGIFFIMELRGIYPYIKNEDRAKDLQRLINLPPLGYAPNFRTLFRILRSEASPYRNLKSNEIVFMINKGGTNIYRFWNICIKNKIPLVYSPNLINLPFYEDLTIYNKEEGKDKTLMLVGPFR